jgi:hypothetical protein
LEFEDVCSKDFVENCEVLVVGGKNKRRLTHAFETDTGFYKHPSAVPIGPKNHKTLHCPQGARLCEHMVHAKISQCLFPDAVDFQANTATCHDVEIDRSVEKCVKAALCPLMSHLSVQDSQCAGTMAPHGKKSQEVCHCDCLAKTGGGEADTFIDANIEFLQNVQSCGGNSMQHKIEADKLQECTWPWRRTKKGVGADGDDDDKSNGDEEVDLNPS